MPDKTASVSLLKLTNEEEIHNNRDPILPLPPGWPDQVIEPENRDPNDPDWPMDDMDPAPGPPDPEPDFDDSPPEGDGEPPDDREDNDDDRGGDGGYDDDDRGGGGGGGRTMN